jgi:hypothetical protein
MSSTSTQLPSAEGPGSASGAPNLLPGFAGTFSSRSIDIGERDHSRACCRDTNLSGTCSSPVALRARDG